jgi:hypothetical protein
MIIEQDKLWCSKKFKQAIKIGAAQEGKSIVEYTDELASTLKGFQTIDENNKKRFRFSL